MVTALLYLVVVAAVGALLFGLATLVFGRGEELAPLSPRTTLTSLPESDVRGDDVRALRFAQVVRGYRADEVDWALARLAAEIDGLRARLPDPGEAAGSPPVPEDHGRDAGGADERVGAHASREPDPRPAQPQHGQTQPQHAQTQPQHAQPQHEETP